MVRLPALNRFPALRTLALAAAASLPLGGCYYYGDAPMDSYADGACETRYGADYYARDPYAYDDGYGYDCYDSADYRGGFVQIGFGGGWYDDFYYPGYGTWLFNNYGHRYPLRDHYLNYWGGRRAWYKHHGRHGGQYGDGHWQGGGGRGGHHGGDGRGGHPGGGRGDGWNGMRPPRGDDAAPQPSRDRGGVFQQILDPQPGSAPQRPPRGDRRRPPAGYVPAQPVAGSGDVAPAPGRPRWGDRPAPPPVSAAPRPERNWQPPAERVSAPPPPSASPPQRSYSPPQRSYSAPVERSAPPAPRSEPAQRAPTPSRDQTGPVRDD